jgi:hypothetical protein
MLQGTPIESTNMALTVPPNNLQTLQATTYALHNLRAITQELQQIIVHTKNRQEPWPTTLTGLACVACVVRSGT